MTVETISEQFISVLLGCSPLRSTHETKLSVASLDQGISTQNFRD